MSLLVLALACAPKPTPATEPAGWVEGGYVEYAPTPFTVEQIRAGLPAGTHIRLRISMAGEPPVEQRWTFTRCDDATATIASQVHAADGSLLQDEGESTSTWLDLHGHALFPAMATARTEETIDTEIGRVDAWLYTVQAVGEDGVPIVKRLWFSKKHPGPPVLYTIQREGVEVFRMVMTERR